MQIVRKRKGRSMVLRTLVHSREAQGIAHLEAQAHQEIAGMVGQYGLFADPADASISGFLRTLSNAQVHVVGPELVFGSRYDAMGYGAIGEELFRHLVVARLAFPGSKLKTVDYLRRYRGLEISPDSIYRFLDRLARDLKEKAEEITYAHTAGLLGGTVGVVFYDMTTLHFEASDEDDLRRIGYSKSGKHQHPQIQLGLLVSAGGYPIGYEVFEGNKYEGATLLGVIARFEERFAVAKPTVIADAGLLNKENLRALEEGGYHYILGARIKNESDAVKESILRAELGDGTHMETATANGARLIVHMSASRAAKDQRNRQRGLRRLERMLRSGKLTKTHINNRGYNKYLRMEGDLRVSIDHERFRQDEAWDGLKGYVTNSSMEAKEVLANYRELWRIERAFRISKTDLRVRPIHHRLSKRITAHICVAFVAYAVYKEVERLLKAAGSTISATRAKELSQTIYQLRVVFPNTRKPEDILLGMTPEQQQLLSAMT